MNENFLQQQICDFTKMQVEGTVEIKPINPKRFNQLSFRSFTESTTGITYGIPIGKTNTGETVFRRITISGNRYYDLKNKNDAMEWHVVKNFPAVKGSPYQKGVPLLYIYDVTQEAVSSLKKIHESRQALDIALALDGSELKDFARTIGINPENNDIIVVKQLVSERAMLRGADFLTSFYNPNRTVAEIFKRAENTGLITMKMGVGYMYKDTYPLGTNEPAALVGLSKQRDLMMTIDAESKELLAGRDSTYATPVVKAPKAPAISKTPPKYEEPKMTYAQFKEMEDAAKGTEAQNVDLLFPNAQELNLPENAPYVRPARNEDFAEEQISFAQNAFSEENDNWDEQLQKEESNDSELDSPNSPEQEMSATMQARKSTLKNSGNKNKK